MTASTLPNPPGDFQSLGVAPQILEHLARKRILVPTPIQRQSIAAGIAGKDIVGIAQTGTGKTLAFGIPMLQRLAQNPGKGLILIPTRELAYQVEESLSAFARALNISAAVIIGGVSIETQKNALRRNPRIIIATPGRLKDHLQQRTIDLSTVNILVLDEADRMFDMGFWPQIEYILRSVPRQRQTLLFSATMPPQIMNLAKSQMQLPLRIEVAPQGTTVAGIQQELFLVQKTEKLPLLEKVIAAHTGSVLVFSRTKHGAKKITQVLRSLGHNVAEIHANRSLSQRREALAGFKVGKYRILIATDIAARGIDVAGIAVVINYDLPDDPSDYVHRIGRTARAGLNGLAISFATADQRSHILKIERLIRSTLKVLPTPKLPPSTFHTASEHTHRSQGRRPSRPFGQSSSFGGRSSHYRKPGSSSR